MEILLQETIDLERVADLCARSQTKKPATQRDHTVWHVTNLLESARLIARGDPRYHEFHGSPSGIMSMGRIWESVMDCYLHDYAVSRGGFYEPDIECDGDGIVASLDGIMGLPGNDGLIVCETKLRFSRSSEIPIRHTQQMLCYCYLAGANTVCYVSGYLTSSPMPSAGATLRVLRFDDQAIAEMWKGIVSTKDYLIKLGCGPDSSVGDR